MWQATSFVPTVIGAHAMENRVNIGSLDTLVTIQTCVVSSGSQGQKTKSYQNHSQVWASVERNTSEQIDNSNLEADTMVTLTIHKIDALTSRWRVIIEGKTYEISAIDPISRSSRFQILTLHSIDGQ